MHTYIVHICRVLTNSSKVVFAFLVGFPCAMPQVAVHAWDTTFAYG